MFEKFWPSRNELRGEAERDEERRERVDDPVVAVVEPPDALDDARSCRTSGPVANAAVITASSVAASPSNSATTRPARITSTRCARPSTSSISDEISSTAIPSRASPIRSSWICRFAPTSTPRVGSSAISSFGRRKSHFANSTFCWLPPESVVTIASCEAVRTSRSSRELARAARSRRGGRRRRSARSPARRRSRCSRARGGS